MPLPFFPFPPSHQKYGHLNPARWSGERCKLSPVGSGAKSQPTNDLVHILESKSAALVAAVFIDFFWEQTCKFMSEIQFLIGRRPMRSYSSCGTRHHCPTEVGACVCCACCDSFSFVHIWCLLSIIFCILYQARRQGGGFYGFDRTLPS